MNAYICPYCGKSFDNGKSLGGHVTSCVKNFGNISKQYQNNTHSEGHSQIQNWKKIAYRQGLPRDSEM